MTEPTDADRAITAQDNHPPEPIIPALPPIVTDEEIEAKLAAKHAEDAEADDTPLVLPYDGDAHFALQVQVDSFVNAAKVWFQRVPKIQVEDQAKRLNDYLSGATKLKNLVEEARRAAKKPWDDRAQAVQDAFKPMTDDLELAQKWFKPLQTAWLLAEKDRIAREKQAKLDEAAAKKREADALLAQAAVNGDIRAQREGEALQKEAAKDEKVASRDVRPSVGSASGGARTVGLRKTAYAHITNQNAVYMQFREHPRVVEVLQSLADAEVRGGGTVNGAERRERESV